MKTWTLMLAAVALATACTKTDDQPQLKEGAPDSPETYPMKEVTLDRSSDQPATYVEPQKEPTALDQSNKQPDLDVTQAIRKSFMADDGLSMEAKNAQIITKDGVVTLKGLVKSEAERTNLVAKAKSASGVERVENLLEVQPDAQ